MSSPQKHRLEDLRFDNSFVRELPADAATANRRRQVHNACYSLVSPTPVARPQLLAHSREVLAELGLSSSATTQSEFAQILAGNQVAPSMQPYAACYGGHQFGNWAGQLGDGRAISLAEVLGPSGARYELQLKGAGPTPYSRTADGRAVLRSSVREFLCSEAMAHLGVPTTRALSLVLTGDQVERDMLYDGRPRLERGAVVCRVAPSFLRFGSFELPTSRGEFETLKRLVSYAITHHFPEIAEQHGLAKNGTPSAECVASFLEEVARRTAWMVAHWLRVGFVHGVMNTDNLSILGLTIDYGPYGWVDNYDPDWTPNTTDSAGRRYRFGTQPQVASWGLNRFAEALLPLIEETARAEQALEVFATTFENANQQMQLAKLGLSLPAFKKDGTIDWVASATPSLLAKAPDDVAALQEELETLLQTTETDMTLFYRGLAEVPLGTKADTSSLIKPLLPAYYNDAGPSPEVQARTTAWLQKYERLIEKSELSAASRSRVMTAANPLYVLRNYLAQEVIDQAEQGDTTKIEAILEVLRHPYTVQPNQAAMSARRPDWARNKAGCSMLSCSS